MLAVLEAISPTPHSSAVVCSLHQGADDQVPEGLPQDPNRCTDSTPADMALTGEADCVTKGR